MSQYPDKSENTGKRSRTDDTELSPNDPILYPPIHLPSSNPFGHISPLSRTSSNTSNIGSPSSFAAMQSAQSAEEHSNILTEEEPNRLTYEELNGLTYEEPLDVISDSQQRELTSDIDVSIHGVPDFPSLLEELEGIPKFAIPVSEALNVLSGVAQFLSESAVKVTEIAGITLKRIKSYGDSIIAETQFRRKEQEIKEASKTIQKATDLLQSIKDKTKTIQTQDVLRMIELETLIETVMDDAIPESIRQVPALLVMPILEIVCHYDEYFSWDDTNIRRKIGPAYDEFRNKQRIRDMFAKLYGENVTINRVIDDLFTLYDRNFTLDRKPGLKEPVLSINGRLRVIKSIHTGPPNNIIATIPGAKRKESELPTLSAIDYSEIWNRNAEEKNDVDAEIAEIRNAVPAAADNTPTAGVGVAHGRNTRDWNIAGNAGFARFDVPLAQVIPVVNREVNEEEQMGSQISNVSDFYSQPGDEDNGPDIDITDQEARFQIISAHLTAMGQPLSPDVQTRLQAYAAKREEGSRPNEMTGRMAEIATQRMAVANNLTDLIVDVGKEFESGIFADLQPEEKQQAWERQIHRIFMEWYNQNKGLEQKRDRIKLKAIRPVSKAPEPSGFWPFGKGGIKSKKNHKKQQHKQQKKQTRKTGGKRFTLKLRKNHKKRLDHTKKH